MSLSVISRLCFRVDKICWEDVVGAKRAVQMFLLLSHWQWQAWSKHMDCRSSWTSASCNIWLQASNDKEIRDVWSFSVQSDIRCCWESELNTNPDFIHFPVECHGRIINSLNGVHASSAASCERRGCLVYSILRAVGMSQSILTKILDHHGWRKDSFVVSLCKWARRPSIILRAQNEDPCFWINRYSIEEMMQYRHSQKSSSKCVLWLKCMCRNKDFAHVTHSQTIDLDNLRCL